MATPERPLQGKGSQLGSIRKSHQSLATSRDSKGAEKNVIVHELVHQNQKMSSILESNQKKQGHTREEILHLKHERAQLIELDIKKNQIIEHLESKIRKLESQQ